MAQKLSKPITEPIPKPPKKEKKVKRYLKRSGKRIKPGKKVNQWAYIRSQLKIEFTRQGLTFCEVCGATEALTMAHRLKRRFITTDEELRTVAILCIRDHEEIERLPHSEMYRRITEIINRRESAY